MWFGLAHSKIGKPAGTPIVNRYRTELIILGRDIAPSKRHGPFAHVEYVRSNGSTQRKYVINSVVTPFDERAPSLEEAFHQAVDSAKWGTPEASRSTEGFCETWKKIGTAMFGLQASTQPLSDAYREACAQAKGRLLADQPSVGSACESRDEDHAAALALELMRGVKTACGNP